jgi:hypothetical protein
LTTEEIYIQKDEGFEVFDFDKKSKSFKILNYVFNANNNSISFIKNFDFENTLDYETAGKRYKYNELYFRDINTLIGKENGYEIQYNKKKRVD